MIATDVGGTTFKVAIIEGGDWAYAKETVLNQYQLRLPMVDVASIGAGGGSIAWVDGGRLRVGPKSASADPGPACYGLGGTEPTVTDADVVLGYISPDRFLGGRMKLQLERAADAIRQHIADPLFGGDVIAAAAGIRRVVDARWRTSSARRRWSAATIPRDFVMMAYGGAGPVHAASYGGELGVPEIIVPFQRRCIPPTARRYPTSGSACASPSRSCCRSMPRSSRRSYAPMEREGERRARPKRTSTPASRRFERWVEARYRRQVHTVRIPRRRRRSTPPPLAADRAGFEREYERLFGPGSGLKDAGVELVNYGVDAVGVVDKPAPAKTRPAAGRRSRASHARDLLSASRAAWCRRRSTTGRACRPAPEIDGPAVIEHPGTTIVVLHRADRADRRVRQHPHHHRRAR